MRLLDRVTAPFRALVDAEGAGGDDSATCLSDEARAEQAFAALVNEFADAQSLVPKPYSSLSIGEARLRKTPAVEYMHHTRTVHLYYVMEPEQLAYAAVPTAIGARYDDRVPGTAPELVDLKPHESAPIEHGVIVLGPVPEFADATGSRWRFFLELTYSAAAGSFRGGLRTRRFIVDCTLP